METGVVPSQPQPGGPTQSRLATPTSPWEWTNQDTGFFFGLLVYNPYLCTPITGFYMLSSASSEPRYAVHSHCVLELWWKSGDLVAEECLTAWPCIYCSRASSFSLIESFYIYVFFGLDVSYMCTSINANLVVSVRETSFYSIIIMQRPSGNFTEDRGCV